MNFMINDLTIIVIKVLNVILSQGPYMFPLIGAFQLFILSFFEKSWRILSLSIILIVLTLIISPFMKLLPNLGADSFSEIKNFDLNEALFYVRTLSIFSGWNFKIALVWSALITSYIIFLISLYFFLQKKNLNFIFKKIYNYLILTIMIVPFTYGIYNSINLFKKSYDNTKKLEKNFITNTDNLELKIVNDNDLSVLLYIGESTTKLHWSLYNYFRPTSENLEKFSKKNKVILFDKVISPHTHTTDSLLAALSIETEHKTGISLPTPIKKQKRISIIDVLNKSNVKSTVYSNHGKTGPWNQASSLIFKNSSLRKHSSKHVLGNADFLDKDKPFDHEFLLEFIDQIKNNTGQKKNFYVFHSYAGHGDYKKYIPTSYHHNIDNKYSKLSNSAIFGKKFKLNQKNYLENYDSAMKYVSDNIAQTLESISNLKEPIVFIYTSDHGESPLTSRGHDSSRYTWEMSAVPFLIYFNDSAKKKYIKLYDKIRYRSELNKRENVSNLPSLLLELYGIKITNLNNKIYKDKDCKFGTGNCLDLFHSVRDQIEKVGLVNLDYPSKNNNLYKDNADRATIHSNIYEYFIDKNSNIEICSHRSNSLARVIRYKEILNCLELDLVIEQNYLDVRHPPNKTTNLKLADVLEVLKNKKTDTKLWLDIKNLNSVDKCTSLFKSLSKLSNVNYGKLNLFIEFPSNVYKKLNIFENCISNIQSLKFSTSYYIPNKIVNKCKQDFNDTNCIELEEILIQLYKSKLFSDISFDYSNISIITELVIAKKFKWNVWNIKDEDIFKLENNQYNLIIPINDNLNYN